MNSPNPGFADLVGLKMVFGLQMDISEDSGEDSFFFTYQFFKAEPVVTTRDLGRDFFHKTWKQMEAFVFEKHWCWILAVFGIGFGTWRICEEIGV